MTDLLASASTLRKALLARAISSEELLDATLARIEAFNPALNAIVAMDAVSARRAARDSDVRIAEEQARPLEGLPITVKDAFDVADIVSTGGAPALRARIPREDARAVARLREAGAVILGKSNVPVFSADFQTANPVYGRTNNPWNPAYSPGGSSGGAAAAVATGMSALELGSDLAGSIRWPAHACGVFGLRTTWGLVSTFGHVPPPPDWRRMARNPELLVAGPIARSAADLALVLSVIAGPRAHGGSALPLRPPGRASAPGLRVALWPDDPFAAVDRSVAAAVERAARLLEDAGAHVDDRARPGFRFEEIYEVFAVLQHAVVAWGLPPKVRDRLAAPARNYPHGDLSHRALQARGARLTPGGYHELDARRRQLRRRWERFFENFDIVLCPPAPVGAIPHDDRPDLHARTLNVNGAGVPYLDFLKWAAPAGGADLPAAVAPVMLGPDGLPRGVQIIAAHGQDATAVAVAGLVEELSGGWRPPPLAVREAP